MLMTYLLTTSFTAILNLLVFAFCCCLFGNQLHLINKNRSFIDNLSEREDNFGIEKELAEKYKNNDELKKFQQKSCFGKLASAFGDKNVLWWLLPV